MYIIMIYTSYIYIYVYTRYTYQVIQSDPFGMVKWPFQGLSDLQLGDKKGHFESPGIHDIYTLWLGGFIVLV